MWARGPGVQDFEAYRRVVISRGESFADMCRSSTDLVAEKNSRFIPDNAVILTCSLSKGVLALLQRSAQEGTHFSVVVAESRPDGGGYLQPLAEEALWQGVRCVLTGCLCVCAAAAVRSGAGTRRPRRWPSWTFRYV